MDFGATFLNIAKAGDGIGTRLRHLLISWLRNRAAKRSDVFEPGGAPPRQEKTMQRHVLCGSTLSFLGYYYNDFY